MTSQHLNKHGKVLRSNRLFVTAKHYTNEGGAVADRNDEREQYNIAVLKYKWPGVFKQHPTRGENEVTKATSHSSLSRIALMAPGLDLTYPRTHRTLAESGEDGLDSALARVRRQKGCQARAQA